MEYSAEIVERAEMSRRALDDLEIRGARLLRPT
jgi:hypothetical protein